MYIDINSNLSPIDLLEVERVLFYDITSSAEINDRIICSIGNEIPLRGNAIRSLGPAEQINREMVEGMQALFSLLDNTIEASSNDVNATKRNYIPYKKSFYYGSKVFEDLMNDSAEFCKVNKNSISLSTYRIYFMIETKLVTRKAWQLIIIDFNKRCYYHYDPSKEMSSRIDSVTLQTHENEHSSISYTSNDIKRRFNLLIRECLVTEEAIQWDFAASDLILRVEVNEDDFS
jgi:hypothetical protein